MRDLLELQKVKKDSGATQNRVGANVSWKRDSGNGQSKGEIDGVTFCPLCSIGHKEEGEKCDSHKAHMTHICA